MQFKNTHTHIHKCIYKKCANEIFQKSIPKRTQKNKPKIYTKYIYLKISLVRGLIDCNANYVTNKNILFML